MNARQRNDRLNKAERNLIKSMTDDELRAIVGDTDYVWPGLCSDAELEAVIETGMIPPRFAHMMRTA